MLDRLTVGLKTLNLPIVVRIHVQQLMIPRVEYAILVKDDYSTIEDSFTAVHDLNDYIDFGTAKYTWGRIIGILLLDGNSRPMFGTKLYCTKTVAAKDVFKAKIDITIT